MPTGGAPGGARPTTGGGGFSRRSNSEGFERWEFWWEHNKEPFLDLKSRLGSGQVVSDSGGFLTGRSNRSDALSSIRPSAEDVKNVIIPELLPLLKETHADVVDSAVLAIARMVKADDGAAVLKDLAGTVRHEATTARQSATLALGVLESRDAIPYLRDLMLDTPKGRELNGKPAGVEDMVRAFAAASLGLIGDESVFEDLKGVIASESLNTHKDLKSMAILSLGLMPQRHTDIIPFLLQCMTDDSLDRVVRAQAPIALGKLNDPLVGNGSPDAIAALPQLMKLFSNDKTDTDMLRSLAVCIGMLASVENTDVLDALIETVDSGEDDQTRHFAIMALAQIGHRDPDPAAHAEAHAKIESFLTTELVKPKRITHQPYGALGLAVYARDSKIDGLIARASSKILSQFVATNNPSYQGAMAVGLGLLNAKEAQADLKRQFEESNDQQLQGYVALALGLMRTTDMAEEFHKRIQVRALDFKYRLQLARALGLMGDVKAVTTLVDYLQSADTLSETSSCAQALGLIGDRSAVQPLLAVIKDQSKQEQQRGFSCVALGLISEKATLPWNVVFAVNSNYRAKTTALSEILDIL